MHHRTPLLRRALAALAGVGLLTFGAAACAPGRALSQPTAAPSSSEATYLVSLVNNYRAANGLPPLTPAGDAMAKAQSQAGAMAASGSIFHSDLASGITPGWQAIGENVGSGPNVDVVESSFQASPAHNANLLSGAFNQIGVGVVHAGNGMTYVAEEFVGR